MTLFSNLSQTDSSIIVSNCVSIEIRWKYSFLKIILIWAFFACWRLLGVFYVCCKRLTWLKVWVEVKHLVLLGYNLWAWNLLSVLILVNSAHRFNSIRRRVGRPCLLSQSTSLTDFKLVNILTTPLAGQCVDRLDRCRDAETMALEGLFILFKLEIASLAVGLSGLIRLCSGCKMCKIINQLQRIEMMQRGLVRHGSERIRLKKFIFRLPECC